MKKLSVEEVSSILFLADPMGTGCQENDVKDEYQSEAYKIVSLIKLWFDVQPSVIFVFEHSFWSGCLSNVELEEIVANINELVIE